MKDDMNRRLTNDAKRPNTQASNHMKILFLEKEIDRIKHIHKLGKIETKEAVKQIKMYEAVLAELVNDMPQYYKEVYNVKKENYI